MGFEVLKDTFKAQLDKQPPGTRFRVTGQVKTMAGWKVELVKSVPQGSNPTIILLDVKVQKPEGLWREEFKTYDVAYEEDPAQEEYKQATIRVDQRPVRTIDVDVTH
jgi:hypothetical protein